MSTPYTAAILIYDPKQLSMLGAMLPIPEDTTIVSLDAEVDMLLRDKGVAFLSGRDYRSKTAETLLAAEQVASLIEQPEWDWFSYRGIRFSKIFFSTLQSYFLIVLYWIDICTNLLAANPNIKKITVLPPAQTLPRSGAFIVRRELLAVNDSVMLVAAQRGVEVAALAGGELPPAPRPETFAIMRTLWGAALAILNGLVSLTRPRRAVRVLASDYWRNIAPVLPHIPNVEVVMYDRKEVFSAGLKNIWRYRMRFMSAADFGEKGAHAGHEAAWDAVRKEWSARRASLVGESLFRDISIRPLIDGFLDEIMQTAVPAQMQEIDRTYAMLEWLNPQVILLRATVSQQWHFLLFALVGQKLGIPSIELLHGMEYVGQGSFDKRHLATYVGVYGAHTQRQLIAAGFPSAHIPIVGSPRFDQYHSAEAEKPAHEKKDTVIFCTAPDLFLGGTFDTYDIEHYFRTIAESVRGVPAEVIIKLRPGPRRESFYRRAVAEAFSGIPHQVAQYEPLKDLFAQADMAVSCQSTVTLEALQCNIPLVLYAATALERMMLEHNFRELAQAGAVELCMDDRELLASVSKVVLDREMQERLAGSATTYLAREFAFDGKSAERTAELVCSLAAQPHEGTSATIEAL